MHQELKDAERKAWDALSRYKFWMFGYWAAIWIHLNRVSGLNQPNPWIDLVKLAREKRSNYARQKPCSFSLGHTLGPGPD